MNLQDMFLNQIRKEKISVTIHLVNGSTVKGILKGFDSFSIFIKNDHQELIYKHAIVSIVPQKEIQSIRDPEERGMHEKKSAGAEDVGAARS